jgi:hypothetical protein
VKLDDVVAQTDLPVAPRATVSPTLRDPDGAHPERHPASWTGFDAGGRLCRLQGFYESAREPAPIVEAVCWMQAWRKLFDLALHRDDARRQRHARHGIDRPRRQRTGRCAMTHRLDQPNFDALSSIAIWLAPP